MARKNRFEFILYIQNKQGKRSIICQRFFDVDGYNPSCVKSLEAKEMIDDCVEMIRDNLKEKAEDYLWRYHNPYITQNPDLVVFKDNYEFEDLFEFEVKVDNRLLGIRRFTANDFPPKVKYSVDIKPLVPKIVNALQYYMSKRNYEKMYLDTVL
jgi:hypothetical protein